MGLDWLWDRNIPDSEVKNILNDERHPRFVELAALLLARKNSPKVVFGDFLTRKLFARNWARIKKQMRSNAWNEPRIVFWQAVYEKVFEDLKSRGESIRVEKDEVPGDEVCHFIGDHVRKMRKTRKMTQAQLADKLEVSQQIVSRIEQGRENFNMSTINRLAKVFGQKIRISFEK